MVDLGNPNITVGRFIGPPPVIGQLVFVLIKLLRKIASARRTPAEAVSGVIPLGEVIVDRTPEAGRLRKETAVRDNHFFPGLDQQRILFPGRFGFALKDEKLGLFVLADAETEKPFFQNVERAVRSVDFKTSFFAERVNPQINIPGQKMNLDRIVASLRQVDQVNLSEVSDAQAVFMPEMDFCSAFAGPELVPFNKSQVDNSFFITHVSGTLDEDISFDITQTSITVAVIFLLFRRKTEGNKKDEKKEQK